MSDSTTNNPVSQDETDVTQRLSALSGVLEELKAEVSETSVHPLQPEQPAPEPPPASVPDGLSETLAFETSNNDEDESIESYMAALLERSNGFASPEARVLPLLRR